MKELPISKELLISLTKLYEIFPMRLPHLSAQNYKGDLYKQGCFTVVHLILVESNQFEL